MGSPSGTWLRVPRCRSCRSLTLSWSGTPGVSYGLFPAHGGWGTALLALFSLGAVAGLGWWLWNAQRRALAIGLGLVIGGAIGQPDRPADLRQGCRLFSLLRPSAMTGMCSTWLTRHHVRRDRAVVRCAAATGDDRVGTAARSSGSQAMWSIAREVLSGSRGGVARGACAGRMQQRSAMRPESAKRRRTSSPSSPRRR